MKSKFFFNPEEIIFSAGNACNLHCSHCFVSRSPDKLNAEAAIKLMQSCKDKGITRIGFTGGEPFLYMDFLVQIIQAAIKMDYIFDQIMTNGSWWKTEEELKQKLKAIYDAGYDGKFGLSWDSFHGQAKSTIKTFISCAEEIFGRACVNIQTVLNDSKLTVDTSDLDVPVYNLSQSFKGDDERAWNSRKWFKEDYCQGPGNIFYVHSSGNIAPCCGFANENPELFIGRITDSWETLMENARNNRFVKICYETGLSSYKKQLKKQLKAQGKKFPGKGKCGDICSFCDFACNNK